MICRTLPLIITVSLGHSGRTRLNNSINRPLTIANLPSRINRLFMNIAVAIDNHDSYYDVIRDYKNMSIKL